MFLGVDRDKSGRIGFFWVLCRDVGFRSPNRDCPDKIESVGKYGCVARRRSNRVDFQQNVLRKPCHKSHVGL